MPGVELSRLNRNEMRRLLAAAETRRDHALAQRLRTELDGRGAPTAGAVQPMHPAAERFDRDRAGESGSAKDWDTKDWETKIWDAEDGDVPEKAGSSRRVGATVLAVAAAAVVAMAIGWQLGRREQNAPAPPPSAAIAPAQIVAPAALVPELLPPQPPTSTQLAVEVAPAPPVAAKPAARPETTRAERRAERRAGPERPPRDRRMLQAYDRARAAGVDPLTLDADQARFRSTVESTRDPIRTNALYARRIQELEAAARRER